MGKEVTFKSLGSKILKGFSDHTDLELVEWKEWNIGNLRRLATIFIFDYLHHYTLSIQIFLSHSNIIRT